MRDVHEAMAEAEASLAAIDMDKVRFAAMSAPLASVVVDMPHVRLSAEDRAEIKATIDEARAEMAAVNVDRAEIARSLEEDRADLAGATLDHHRAVHEQHREREEPPHQAQREQKHALRHAEAGGRGHPTG